MTISQKIIAAHALQKNIAGGKKEIFPGEFIQAKVDLALGNDITAPIAINEFEGAGFKKVFDPEKIVFVLDHFTPNKDLKSAQQCEILKRFSRKHKIKNYFAPGRGGIEHVLLPEKGLVFPGDLIVGADSHTCTYGALAAFSTGVGSTDLAAVFYSGLIWLKVPPALKFIYYGKRAKWVGGKDLILYTISRIGVEGANYCSMEFSGEAISTLPMADRFALCNMAIEAGAKNGIIAPDERTRIYIKKVSKKNQKKRFLNFELLKSDVQDDYKKIYEYDASKIEPQVAFPSLPSKCKPISKVGKIYLDQVLIGSCTNGRIEDLRMAAEILSGHKVCSHVRLIVIPATQQIYLQAIRERLMEIFVRAGAIVSPPTCGPCLGGHMGVLAKGEVCLSTTNRNFMGRMGDLKSKVYLCNPAVAAASAIKGRIASPEEVKSPSIPLL